MDTRRKPKRTPKLPIKKVDYKDRILKTLKEADRPMSYKELGMKVRFAPKDIEAFKNALRQLKRDNKIEVKNDRFRLRRIKGTPALITRVNETFGFAKLLDETESEVFIPGSCLRGAMPKDEVMLKVYPRRPRFAGGGSAGDYKAV